jgi:hypothetical protein
VGSGGALKHVTDYDDVKTLIKQIEERRKEKQQASSEPIS